MRNGIFSRIYARRPVIVHRLCALAMIVIGSLSVASSASAQDADREHEASAREALEEYFRAWNAGDNDAVAAVSNFPRLSLGQNGQVVVRETPEDIITDFEALRQTGWDHSTLDLAEAVQVAADKVHFRIVFSRHTAGGSPYSTVPALYVVTNQNGHWGLQLQSILPATFTR